MRRFSAFRKLPARSPDEPHRASTQFELLFDLISVIAIAAVTHGLHHAISEGHGLEKLPVFLFLFTSIWWAWMNFTWFASAFDSDTPGYRLMVMVVMVGELIFAGGATHIFKTVDFSWGLLGWAIMRLGMAALWLRAAANTEYRTTCLRYAIGIMIAQACWIALYFNTVPASNLFYAFGLLCFAVEFSVPIIAESARVTPFHRHHIIERYGLLTIISLGEVMLSISLGFGMLYDAHPSWAAVRTAIAALVIAFAIFWIYFCEDEHLPKTDLRSAITWGYLHVFIFAAIASLAAGIAAELDFAADHSHANPATIAWWLGAPLAVFSLALWAARDRHYSTSRHTLALPAMAAASIAASFAGAPSWAFALIAVIALVWRVPIFSSRRQDLQAGAGQHR